MTLGSQALERDIFAAGVQAVYAGGWLPFAAQLANGALLVYGLWGSLPHRTLLGWYAVMTAITLLRLALWYPASRRDLTPAEAPRLARLYTLGAAASGLVWGSGAFLLFPSDYITGQVLLAFVLGGMTAGAAASYTGHAPSFYAYAVPAVIPLDLRFFVQAGAISHSMGLMLLLFLMAMASVNRRGGRNIRDARRLRISNTQLLERVALAQERLEELNRGLEERVQVRTSELEATAAELARSGYLARLGSLAAGLAHEINNPLAYVTSNLSFLKRLTETESVLTPEARREAIEVVTEALEGAERVRATVGHLKAMAQRDDDASGPVDLHSVLESCIAVSRSELRKRAALVRNFGEIPRVFGKPGQLSQVFLNILFNAAEALPPERLALNRIEIATCRLGDEVEVRITDNGPAVALTEREQVFEPLAELGPLTGSGLGLSMSRNVVNELGGRLELHTSPAGGTTCSVFLTPLAEG